MLSNFVAQADLVKWYPKLASYLPSTQSDWTTQITEAFNIVLDDVRSLGWEPRKMMIPLDLKRAANSTDDQNVLTSSTQIVSTTGTHINGRTGFNRLVVVTSAITGVTGYSIQLQGSNDIDVNDSTEPTNWAAVGSTIAPIATGTSSTVIQTEYKYYRYVNTVTAQTPSITFTIGLYETYPDRWIIHKALEMIFSDLARVNGDVNEERMKRHVAMYAQALKSHKFTLDLDDDNLVDEGEADDPETGRTILIR